jgi:hypothetical protein
MRTLVLSTTLLSFEKFARDRPRICGLAGETVPRGMLDQDSKQLVHCPLTRRQQLDAHLIQESWPESLAVDSAKQLVLASG